MDRGMMEIKAENTELRPVIMIQQGNELGSPLECPGATLGSPQALMTCQGSSWPTHGVPSFIQGLPRCGN